ncbi:hypothetical protein GKG40_18935 [Eubacterium sp. BIOML-A1]|nr:hypothetical protein [Eubacterium sp. BIOML-A1]MSD08320.1 hypothetical protein [Eubacterium sp. BIOML-A2]
MKKAITLMRIVFSLRKCWQAICGSEQTKNDFYKMAAVTDNVSELFPPAYISDAGVNSFSEQARRFYSKLNTVGVMAMLNIYSGNNPEISHGFECIDTVYSRDNANKMIAF